MEIQNKYVRRLYEEWRTHGKIIVSVDFDDTIFPFKMQTQEELQDTINLIKEVVQVGAYIVIFSASAPERHEEIQAHCVKLGIPCDAINKNPIALPYGEHGKIYYNINLCDRSGLEEAKDILRETMYLMRSYKRSKVHLDEIG